MKPFLHHPPILAFGLALLIAASGMLLASGAQAATHRGAVLVKNIHPGGSSSITEPDCSCGETSYGGGDLTNVHGTLYFSADDGTHGYEALAERRHLAGNEDGQGHQSWCRVEQHQLDHPSEPNPLLQRR